MQRLLDQATRARFARHLSLPEIGDAGQAKLQAASVLVVGAGGLGSPAAQYLVAAGVGSVTLLDDDTIEASNLQRQILFAEAEIGARKVEMAARRLRATSSFTRVEALPQRLNAANARSLIRPYDLVVNGTDNFPARYVLNDACVLEGKPHVHGAVHRFQGEVTLFWPGLGPCYRCLHPQPPAVGSVPSCRDAGVIGVLPGILGCLQALEAIKFLLEIGESLRGRLLLFDGLRMQFREVRVAQDPACALCGTTPTLHEPQEAMLPCCQEGGQMKEITPQELAERLKRRDAFRLVDVREPEEWAIARIPEATLVPVRQLPVQSRAWDPDDDIVVLCRSGRRSADVQAFLMAQGFTRVANLRGGILAWSEEVDPTIPKY